MDDAPGLAVICERLRCRLPARDCATRHVLRLPSGGGAGFPRFEVCAACPVGAARLAQLEAAGWTRPRDTIPASVFDPPQRAAAERWRQSFPFWIERAADLEDPCRRTAAELTPDDRGLDADVG